MRGPSAAGADVAASQRSDFRALQGAYRVDLGRTELTGANPFKRLGIVKPWAARRWVRALVGDAQA